MKDDFFSYLDSCISENKLAHAFLIETNKEEELYEDLLRFLFSKQLLRNEIPENNLNLLTIEPDGKEIKSGAITELQYRYSTMPSFDKYNIYIIKNAEKLNISSANKLLKFLEEPNEGIIGFILTSFNSQILPTVTSRCQLFKYEYKQSALDSENIEQLINYFNLPEYEKELRIRELFKEIERPIVLEICQKALYVLEEQMSNIKTDVNRVASTILLLDKILHLLKSNVNIELVLDKLFIEVR